MKIRNVGIGEAQGPRDEMQDVVLAARRIYGSTDYYGVFDGHGEYGAEIAELTSKTLDAGKDYARFKNVSEKALYAAQLLTDLDDSLRLVNDHSEYSGTTATLAILKKDEVAVAYLGDSEAFYYQDDGELISLTNAHNVHNSSEVKRVTELGHSIDGDHFGGEISVSRAVGDHGRPLVSSKAEINSLKLTVPGTLVIASDGVWGDMHDDIHHDIFSNKRLRQSSALAEYLVSEYAIPNNDNASAVTLRIK